MKIKKSTQKQSLVNIIKIALDGKKRKRKGKGKTSPRIFTKHEPISSEKAQTIPAQITSYPIPQAYPLQTSITGLERTIYTDAIKDLKKEIKDIREQTPISRQQFADGSYGGPTSLQLLGSYTPRTLGVMSTEKMREYLINNISSIPYQQFRKDPYTTDDLNKFQTQKLHQLYEATLQYITSAPKTPTKSGGIFGSIFGSGGGGSVP